MTLLIIEFLEGVETLLHKVCKLVRKRNNINDLEIVSFKNFEKAKRDFKKAKRNHTLLNKNLLLHNDSD